MKKRLLALLLCVSLLLPMLVLPAAAKNDAIITFDPVATEGGSLNGASPWQYATIGEPYGKLPTPINSNTTKEFGGWYTDDFEEITAETICISTGVVVHALWLERELPPFPFVDVKPTDWFYEGISFCYENGLMNGVDGTHFAPNNFCTRAQVVTVLYRMDGAPPVGGLDNPFTDIVPGWYYGAVLWAAEEGIVNGKTPTRFAPNDYITREQLAAILYRYAAYKLYDTSDGVMLVGFEDNGKISGYAREPMSWAVGQGLIQGSRDATGRIYLNPTKTATRAQFATILMRVKQTYEPKELEFNWDCLRFTTPAFWSNYVDTECDSYGISFYCRPEREKGAGGLLCTVGLFKDCSGIPVAYDVVGTVDKDGVTYNVVVMFSGGVEATEYVWLYDAMMDLMPQFEVKIHGAPGYHYSHG